MGNLYLYEWKKLFRQRSFLLFTVVLLLGNLLLLFQYEKQTDVYTLFYRQKQEWQKYSEKNEMVQQAEVYQTFVEREENYVSSYDDFLKQIPKQAEQLKKTANYRDHKTYLYRNLTKTVSDYQKLSTDGVRAESSIGMKELASYHYGIYFQFIFLFVLSYFVVSAERKKGLFLLTKGTEKGHLPFGMIKVLIMVSVSVWYGVLQECSVFFLLKYFYGYGDLTRSIQSVSIFRDCSLPITIWQGLLIMFVVRIAICIFCAVLMICMTMFFSMEGVAMIVYGVFVAIEMFFYHSVEISSPLNILKCVNVFFVWNMKNVLGIYQNLNIFGYPVSKCMVTLVVAGVFLFVFIVVSLLRFSYGCQVSSGNLLEKIREKFAKRISFVWHHTSVYQFEFRKVFVQQRKGVLFLFLFIWCMFSVRDVLEPVYYDDPALGEYHRILSKISGPITEESLAYISSQRTELDEMYEELEVLKQESGHEAEVKKQALQHEVEIRDGGVALVEEQRDLLLEKDGDIFGKLWIDEKKYVSTFYDYKYDLTLFFIVAIVLVLWGGDIEASDNRKGLYALLCATKAGKRQIQRKKKLVCISGMFWCLVCMLIPQFLRYYDIDRFQNMAQKLSDFTSMELYSSVSVGFFLLFLLLAKSAVVCLVCGLLVLLVRKVSNTYMVIGIGVGTVGLTILLFWYFHMDLTIWFLKMFRL